jgi:hypothetical protein
VAAIAVSKQKTIANLLVIVLTSLGCEVACKKNKAASAPKEPGRLDSFPFNAAI